MLPIYHNNIYINKKKVQLIIILSLTQYLKYKSFITKPI